MSQCDHITFSQKASVDAIDVLSGAGKKTIIPFDFRVLARTATRQNQALFDVNLVLVLQLSQSQEKVQPFQVHMNSFFERLWFGFLSSVDSFAILRLFLEVLSRNSKVLALNFHFRLSVYDLNYNCHWKSSQLQSFTFFFILRRKKSRSPFAVHVLCN